MKDFKNLEKLAQRVWVTKSVEEKRTLVKSMVTNFKFKAELTRFMAVINSYNTGQQLDQMAANLALNNTDAVIKG